MRAQICCVVALSIGAVVLAARVVADELVLCTTKDGRTYAADTPPPGCVVTKPVAVPAVQQRAREEGATHAVERSGEIDRRRLIQAIAMQRVMNNTYANGRFIQGLVANGADFPVYGVRICVDSGNSCQYMTPSTLKPGAQGTFSFATTLMGVPDWKVMWDVVPVAEAP